MIFLRPECFVKLKPPHNAFHIVYTDIYQGLKFMQAPIYIKAQFFLLTINIVSGVAVLFFF